MTFRTKSTSLWITICKSATEKTRKLSASAKSWRKLPGISSVAVPEVSFNVSVVSTPSIFVQLAKGLCPFASI